MRSEATQPNPRKLQKTGPNPTQLMGQPNPCPPLIMGAAEHVGRLDVGDRDTKRSQQRTKSHGMWIGWTIEPDVEVAR
jgi:hypothetical protein